MANELKTLVVVEGARLEPRFFEQLKKVFGLNLDIHCLKYNIYLLYKKMKDMGVSMFITNPSYHAEKIFKLTGLYDIMPKIS